MNKMSPLAVWLASAMALTPLISNATTQQSVKHTSARAKTSAPHPRTRGQAQPSPAANPAPPIPDITPEIDLARVSPQVVGRIHQTALNYIHGVTVATSPILGLKSAWNPSDLLYTIPSMNQDLMLLEDRQRFQQVLESMGSSLDTRPLLVFSGGIEGAVNSFNSYTNQNITDVNLATAELDAWAIISSWASGWISIEYDDAPGQTGARVTNSRLYLQRGFLTIGNLDKSPWYFTAGQMFVPFGRYASAMLTSALTKSLARIEARALLIGVAKDGFYSEGYAFRGEELPVTNKTIFQGGVNAGYQNQRLSFGSFDIGAGWVSNIADSLGMQSNRLFPGYNFPSTQFAGFANTVIGADPDDRRNSNYLKHAVPGGNLHMEYGRGIFALITEYAGALRAFDAGDLLYQYKGATPQAVHVEADLNFQFGKRPLTIGAAYDESWQALALNLPKQSYYAVVSTSWWKDTQQSLEYRHDINYARMPNDSVGGGGNGNVANLLPVPTVNVGGTQDMISFLFGVYF